MSDRLLEVFSTGLQIPVDDLHDDIESGEHLVLGLAGRHGDGDAHRGRVRRASEDLGDHADAVDRTRSHRAPRQGRRGHLNELMSDSTDDVLIGITASFTPQLLLRPMLDVRPRAGPRRGGRLQPGAPDPAATSRASFDEAPDRARGAVADRGHLRAGADRRGSWTPATTPVSSRTMSGSSGALVSQAAADSGLPMVVGIPPVPEPAWLDPLDTRSSMRLTVLHGRLVEAFLDGSRRRSRDARRPRRAGPHPTVPRGPTTPATT